MNEPSCGPIAKPSEGNSAWYRNHWSLSTLLTHHSKICHTFLVILLVRWIWGWEGIFEPMRMVFRESQNYLRSVTTCEAMNAVASRLGALPRSFCRPTVESVSIPPKYWSLKKILARACTTSHSKLSHSFIVRMTTSRPRELQLLMHIKIFPKSVL